MACFRDNEDDVIVQKSENTSIDSLSRSRRGHGPAFPWVGDVSTKIAGPTTTLRTAPGI